MHKRVPSGVGSLAAAVIVLLALAALVGAQAAATPVIAVKAARMFDAKTGTNLTNQVILVTGDRISGVGPSNRIRIPAGTKVVDLGSATVLPGLIDGHVHLTDGHGDQRQQALDSAT